MSRRMLLDVPADERAAFPDPMTPQELERYCEREGLR